MDNILIEEVDNQIIIASTRELKPTVILVNGVSYYKYLSDEQMELKRQEIKHYKRATLTAYIAILICIILYSTL